MQQTLLRPCSRLGHSHCFKPAQPPCCTPKHSISISKRSQPTHTSNVVRAAAQATATARSVESLKTWAQLKGIKTDKVDLVPDIQNDLPVLVATTDAQPGDTLLSISDSAWLSAEAVKKSSIGRATGALEPWLQIALLLVSEKFSTNKSASAEFKAYVDSLPTESGSPLLWSQEQQALLQGTQVLESLHGYRTFFQAKYSELQQNLFAQNPALFPSSVFTFDNFVWAVAAVRGRSHAPLDGDKIALVPFADMVAHRRASNAKWQVKSGLFGRGQSLNVEVTRAVRKGEPLSIDFGPDSLDSLVLLDYGVVDTNNFKAGYTLTLTLPESDRFYDDKLDILESNNLAASQTFSLRPDQEPSAEMMAMLRLMQVQGMDAFLLESIFRNDVWSYMLEPLSEPNEDAVCSSMATGAREALGNYSSTISADLALLKSGQLLPGSREEAAVLVRLGEKEALDSALRFFETRRATQLQQLVYYQERRLRRLGLVDDEGRTTYDSFFKDGIA